MTYYLLLGLGKSNLAVAKELIKESIHFDVYMEGESPSLDLPDGEITYYKKTEDIPYSRYTAVIKSPGIPFTHPAIKKCMEEGLVITNEIGYSLKYVEKPIIAITGTNGKTTSTSLIEHILNTKKHRASAVGNIGNSFLQAAKNQKEMLITELSSFQLRDLKEFNPQISIWLNVFQAHLDYHKTFEDYFSSKQNIFINQDPEHLFIYNDDDVLIKKAASIKKGQKKSFSTKNFEANAYFDGEYIWIEQQRFIHKNELSIRGLHNIQNAMASILCGLQYVSEREVISGLKSFNGVEHRLEKVTETDSLKVYNDSKSTNVTAVKAALSAFDEPVILMMGGLDRGNGYENLLEEWKKVKSVICFGQSAEKIYNAAKNYTEAVLQEDIDKAIEIAQEKVSNGGVLLFSPGCASWDRFSSFEERGEYFKSKVMDKKTSV